MANKILTAGELAKKISLLKKSKKRIVFTNGCFDIIHAGHVDCLSAAKSMGDALVLGLNSDRSIRGIKGDKRPIVTCDQRARALAGLECVDYITVFDEPDPWNLINIIKPDILVKGGDWSGQTIIGSDIVEKRGGKTLNIPVTPGISTSIIIQRIIDRHKEK